MLLPPFLVEEDIFNIIFAEGCGKNRLLAGHADKWLNLWHSDKILTHNGRK